MKRIFTKILAITILSNFGFSQDFDVEIMDVKLKIIELNPLLAPFGIYSGSFGMVNDNGTNEIAFPFFYWNISNDDTGDGFSSISLGARYRIYKNKNGKGFFYGPFVGVNNVTITLTSTAINENYEFVETQDEVSGLTYKVGCDIGYRWMWDAGFTLAPSIGIKYNVG